MEDLDTTLPVHDKERSHSGLRSALAGAVAGLAMFSAFAAHETYVDPDSRWVQVDVTPGADQLYDSVLGGPVPADQ